MVHDDANGGGAYKKLLLAGSPSRNRQERQWRGGLRCLGSIAGRLLLACWTAARAAEHTMALACLIDGNNAGKAEDSV